MNVFKVKYETMEDGELYAISIVDDPANGFDFIAMKDKQPVEIKLQSDQKKKILYGIVLRPEQKIYREFEDGTPFMLTFDEPTIERLSQDFFKKGYQSNSTYNHEDNKWLDGTTVVENWIVQDPTNDKANAIGLSVMKGDWVIGMKLSDNLWGEYIETGLAKGFSIDSFIKFEKIDMKKHTCSCSNDNKVEYEIDMAGGMPRWRKRDLPPFHNNCKCELSGSKIVTNEGVCDYCLERIKSLKLSNKNKKENMSMLKKLIKLFSEEAISLASLDTLELGPLTADAFEIGNIVYDANLQPVVSTTFTADNKMYQTDETGTIVEVSDVAEEGADQVQEQLPATSIEADMADISATVVDEVVAATDAIAAEVEKQIEDVNVDELKTQIAKLQADLDALTQEKSAVTMENTQLKEMVASTKLKAEVVKGQSPITMKAKQTSDDSTLSAIERITKKINK
jgi:regulator of replication initiation timing